MNGSPLHTPTHTRNNPYIDKIPLERYNNTYSEIQLKAKLQKTSVQLPPDVFKDMETWPGLSRSEAIRLSIERAHYLSTLDSERIAGIAGEYAPILLGALEDLGYNDYRVAARSLPAIVSGYVRENNNITWRYEGGDQHVLDTEKLMELLNELRAEARIGILDCVVAERHRRETGSLTKAHRDSLKAAERESGPTKGAARWK